MKKIILLILISILFSCVYDDIEFGNNRANNICIYLVKEGQLNHFVSTVDFDTIQLETTPWLKSSEIEFYDWSSHIFYLNKKKPKAKFEGRHFVIKNGETPLLLGLFFASYWSFMPQFPSIIAHDDLFYPTNVVALGSFGFQVEPDSSQKMIDFRQALENSGILREGISVELISLNRKNASTLIYTFQVTNNDDESIYVLDPNKMGAGRFHYFTNGINLQKDNVGYFSQSQSISTSEISSNWYYKLPPHKSMVRTITQDGFSNLPTGNVHYSFSFPGSKAQNGEWNRPGGRIWLGDKFIQGEIELN